MAVEESAFAELARASKPRPSSEHGIQQHLRDHRATVALQFHHVLPGEGIGRRKIEAHAIVEQLAVVSEPGMQGMTRGQGLTNDGLADLERQRAGYAHDAHPALSRRRGDRGDGVGVVGQG